MSILSIDTFFSCNYSRTNLPS